MERGVEVALDPAIGLYSVAMAGSDRGGDAPLTAGGGRPSLGVEEGVDAAASEEILARRTGVKPPLLGGSALGFGS